MGDCYKKITFSMSKIGINIDPETAYIYTTRGYAYV
jgi:hypothetical protein